MVVVRVKPPSWGLLVSCLGRRRRIVALGTYEAGCEAHCCVISARRRERCLLRLEGFELVAMREW